MLKCNKCNQEKHEVEFNFNKSKDRYEYHCKKCHSDYLKKHYQENKKYYKDKSNKRATELREWLFNYKSGLSCIKCGETHVACIEFHHTDADQKDLEISEVAANGWSINRVLEEIRKCIVICSNCHRKLHYSEKTGPWRKVH